MSREGRHRAWYPESAASEPPNTLRAADSLIAFGSSLAADAPPVRRMLAHPTTEASESLTYVAPVLRVSDISRSLVFYRDRLGFAVEFVYELKDYPHIQLRMGVHSGPVNQVTDVNDRTNIAGAGINVAQRVMDCGDAGHILLSKRLADDLAEYRHWRPYLHDLGECEVKYGLRLHLVNLHKDNLGNPHLPEKLKRGRRWKHASTGAIRPVNAPRWRKFALILLCLCRL
jgi:hypothetical protein